MRSAIHHGALALHPLPNGDDCPPRTLPDREVKMLKGGGELGFDRKSPVRVSIGQARRGASGRRREGVHAEARSRERRIVATCLAFPASQIEILRAVP